MTLQTTGDDVDYLEMKRIECALIKIVEFQDHLPEDISETQMIGYYEAIELLVTVIPDFKTSDRKIYDRIMFARNVYKQLGYST